MFVRRVLLTAIFFTAPTSTFAADDEWADLSGRIVCDFYREPQVKRIFDIQRLPRDLRDESLLIDKSSGGLANVLVFVVAAPSRIHPSYDEPADAEAVLRVTDDGFAPRVVVVQLGKQKFVGRNVGTTPNNTAFAPGRGNPAFNVLLARDGEYEYPAKTKLVLPFDITSSIYPWMKAYGMYVDNPYFAVTGADGTFEIKNLPVGERIEYRVWHERFGYVQARGPNESPARHVTLVEDAQLPEIVVSEAELRR